jgi:Methyltransferase domain
MIYTQTDPVKEQVAAHWDRRAVHFDEDFGHSVRTPAERAAWDRILDLILPAAGALEALDIGCGTGFLSIELASRGYRVTGVDFAQSMIALARKKGPSARPRSASRRPTLRNCLLLPPASISPSAGTSYGHCRTPNGRWTREAKPDKEAHGEFDSEYPGYCGAAGHLLYRHAEGRQGSYQLLHLMPPTSKSKHACSHSDCMSPVPNPSWSLASVSKSSVAASRAASTGWRKSLLSTLVPTRRLFVASAELSTLASAQKVGEVIGHGQRRVAEILKLAGLLQPIPPVIEMARRSYPTGTFSFDRAPGLFDPICAQLAFSYPAQSCGPSSPASLLRDALGPGSAKLGATNFQPLMRNGNGNGNGNRRAVVAPARIGVFQPLMGNGNGARRARTGGQIHLPTPHGERERASSDSALMSSTSSNPSWGTGTSTRPSPRVSISSSPRKPAEFRIRAAVAGLNARRWRHVRIFLEACDEVEGRLQAGQPCIVERHISVSPCAENIETAGPHAPAYPGHQRRIEGQLIMGGLAMRLGRLLRDDDAAFPVETIWL